ncbi:hypothetical protein HK097_001020 [Rhizophlyctis rosea]|uniref:RNI-like protein n=1 Tax=Rhizophlyctis rosea TaxID=64517 RepID=A0AAD5SMN4_9FUNG|nr:hypothetical protein HK097_001020 [Rhizophlyctis rosea]
MVRNEVRGPSSALSSFLRERGIRAPRNIFHRRNTANGDNDNQDHNNDDNLQQQGAASTSTDTTTTSTGDTISNANETTPDDAAPSTTSRRRGRRVTLRATSSVSIADDQPGPCASTSTATDNMDLDPQPDDDETIEVTGSISMTLEDDDVEGTEPATVAATASRTTRTNATTSSSKSRKPPAKTPASKSATSKKRKPTSSKSQKDGYQSDAASSDSDFASPNPAIGRSNHSKRQKRTASSISDSTYNTVRFCERCQRRYTVSEDMSSFCPACLSIQSKAGGGGGAGSGISRAKRKRGKIVATLDGVEGPISSLKDMCVKLIATYIDDVEAFGDISDSTKTQISKIISRDRQLNQNNVMLFLGQMEQKVELFDCTYLNESALNQIPFLCPNLRVLHLDEVLNSIGQNCTSLTSLTLKGPFLPSDTAFSHLFTSLGSKLTALHLQHAAKLASSGIAALVENCAGMRELRLDSCMKLGDDEVRRVGELRELVELELSRLGTGVKEESLCGLVGDVGRGLRVLSFNGYPDMTDRVLLTSIAPTCTSLRSLSLEDCESLTTEGMVEFLSNLKTPTGLTKFSLWRNVHLKDEALVACLNDHRGTLEELCLNGLDELTEYGLKLVGGCTGLKEVDLSWIRDLDDFILADILKSCKKLQKVKIYGCSKLTEQVLNQRWENGHGGEIRIVGNEFD